MKPSKAEMLKTGLELWWIANRRLMILDALSAAALVLVVARFDLGWIAGVVAFVFGWIQRAIGVRTYQPGRSALEDTEVVMKALGMKDAKRTREMLSGRGERAPTSGPAILRKPRSFRHPSK